MTQDADSKKIVQVVKVADFMNLQTLLFIIALIGLSLAAPNFFFGLIMQSASTIDGIVTFVSGVLFIATKQKVDILWRVYLVDENTLKVD